MAANVHRHPRGWMVRFKRRGLVYQEWHHTRRAAVRAAERMRKKLPKSRKGFRTDLLPKRKSK